MSWSLHLLKATLNVILFTICLHITFFNSCHILPLFHFLFLHGHIVCLSLFLYIPVIISCRGY